MLLISIIDIVRNKQNKNTIYNGKLQTLTNIFMIKGFNFTVNNFLKEGKFKMKGKIRSVAVRLVCMA